MTPKINPNHIGDGPFISNEEWAEYIKKRDNRMLPVPEFIERYEGMDIVAWDDVPEHYQKKILDGTMTSEDWSAEWGRDTTPVAEVHYLNQPVKVGKIVEDVISDMLNSSPVAKPNHLHVWRKDYNHCMIKTCGAVRTNYGGQ